MTRFLIISIGFQHLQPVIDKNDAWKHPAGWYFPYSPRFPLYYSSPGWIGCLSSAPNFDAWCCINCLGRPLVVPGRDSMAATGYLSGWRLGSVHWPERTSGKKKHPIYNKWQILGDAITLTLTAGMGSPLPILGYRWCFDTGSHVWTFSALALLHPDYAPRHTAVILRKCQLRHADIESTTSRAASWV